MAISAHRKNDKILKAPLWHRKWHLKPQYLAELTTMQILGRCIVAENTQEW